MRLRLFLPFLLLFGLRVFAQSPQLRQAQFNLEKGVALRGYDPVSYHQGPPRRGDPQIRLDYAGVVYQFATEANKAKFEAEPARYEPAFGGWCAWAMADGDKVEVDPENFKIIKGKTCLFYKGWLGNTLKKWNKKADDAGQFARAQEAWFHFLK